MSSRPSLIFALALALVLAATWATLDYVPQAKNTAGASETKTTPNSASPAVQSREMRTEKGDHESKYSKKGSVDGTNIFQWIADKFLDLKLTDLLLVIFTGVLAVKTAGLFKETEGLRRAADKQASDLLRSIKAAETQARVAEDTLTKVQRPYIFAFGVKEIQRDDAEEPFVSFIVVNHGQTPAVVENLGAGFLVHPDKADRQPFQIDALYKVDDDHTLAVDPILPSGEARTDIKDYLPLGLRNGGNTVAGEVVPNFQI